MLAYTVNNLEKSTHERALSNYAERVFIINLNSFRLIGYDYNDVLFEIIATSIYIITIMWSIILCYDFLSMYM